MGICSLSIASPTIAYTSAHCFDEDKNDVGTKVYTDDGRLVGTIIADGFSLRNGYVDAVRIQLDNSSVVPGDFNGKGSSRNLREGTPVQFRGRFTSATGNIWSSQVFGTPLNGVNGTLTNPRMLSIGWGQPGDSGGAVLDQYGRLVGIIRGEGGGNLVMFIPIDNMEELFALG